MQTQAEFVAERMKRHREAEMERDSQLLLDMLNAPPTVIGQREYAAYCYSPGWSTKRQAG